jgi:vacuolar protein-sorting-associated protein 4
MNNDFIPKAVAIVQQAIDADKLGEYETAMNLYKRSLEYFMTGLKYEQNEASKKIILERVDGYMKRAEEIKKVLAEQQVKDSKGGSGGSKTLDKNEQKKNGDKDDDETSKMRGTLSSAIVSEKPNIKWDDVAGLEGAKQALKEAVILPIRFPQVGKRCKKSCVVPIPSPFIALHCIKFIA